MRFWVVVSACICAVLSSANAVSQDLSIDQKVTILEQRLVKQKNLREELSRLHGQLTPIKAKMDDLERRAAENLQNNALKLSFKATYDMVMKVGATSSIVNYAVDLSVDLINNLYIEPTMAKQIKSSYHQQQVRLDDLKNSLQVLPARNALIDEQMETLKRVLKADPPMFDDDTPYFANNPHTAPYWKEADNKSDDNTETATRQIYIISRLSGAISKELDDEMRRVRKDAGIVEDLIDDTRREISRLKSMKDTWDYSPAAQPAPSPEIVQPDKSSKNYGFCAREHMSDSMYNSDTRALEEKRRLLKEYGIKGYRYETRLVVDHPEEARLGDALYHSINLTNPYLPDAENIYYYKQEVLINGKGKGGAGPSVSLRPGRHRVTVLLTSCKELIDKVEFDILLTDPVYDAVVYFQDPQSEVAVNGIVSFTPRIECTGVDEPEKQLNYTYRIFFDDQEETLRDNTKMWVSSYTPAQHKLTEGKHEIRIQLLDTMGNFIDQYLHHLTVVPQRQTASPVSPLTLTQPQQVSGKVKGQAYDPGLEGQRRPVLNLQWAKYDYVFQDGKILIDGFYYWNGQKVNYTSEPILNYMEGARAVPGMFLTKTSGYHIYPTHSSGGSVCPSYIITRMQGTNISIIHRIYGCDFSLSAAPNGGEITIRHRRSPGSELETILLP